MASRRRRPPAVFSIEYHHTHTATGSLNRLKTEEQIILTSSTLMQSMTGCKIYLCRAGTDSQHVAEATTRVDPYRASLCWSAGRPQCCRKLLNQSLLACSAYISWQTIPRPSRIPPPSQSLQTLQPEVNTIPFQLRNFSNNHHARQASHVPERCISHPEQPGKHVSGIVWYSKASR